MENNYHHKKIKVCHVATIDMSLRFLLFNQLMSIKKEGYEVHGISSDGPWASEIKKEGIIFHPVLMKRKISPISDLIAVLKMVSIFTKEKIDIVHTHTPKGGFLGQLAALLSGVPFRLHTIHGFYFHENMNFFKKKFYIMLEKMTVRCSHFVFSQNSEDIETALKEKICKKDKISYLGNGINLNLFSPDKVVIDRGKLLESFGLPENAFIIGSVGRLTFEKGFRELTEAMKGVVERYPYVHLLIIGPDDIIKQEDIRKIAKSAGILDNVHLLGLQIEMTNFYKIMDIFVLPSHREGFPRSLMEAAAMKLPLIATDIRGCREVVSSEKNGLLFPVKNIEALEISILRIIESPDLALRLAVNAREFALKNFDENVVHEKIIKKYSQLMRKKIAYVSTVDMTLHFFFTEQLIYLDKNGYNVWAVASEGRYAKEVREKGINFYSVEMKRGLSSFFDLQAVLKLYLFFKKERFDIVHTHTPKANLLGRIAAKAAGVKKIFATVHGFYFYNMSGIKRWIYVFFNRLGGFCSDKVLIINDYDLKVAEAERIIRKDKIVYLKGGVGVDINKYVIPTLEERKQARNKFRLSFEDKILGFIGRVEKEKGIDDILSAAKLLKERIDGLKYIIVGDGHYLHEYKEKVSKAGLKDNFIFTGFIDSTNELFPLFDIFVFPSLREGLPVVVMEAMAMGVPIVAYKVRGCVDIIENNVDGFLVDKGDIDGLISAVDELIKSSELRKRFSDFGRMKVERFFNRNKIIQDVELLYRD